MQDKDYSLHALAPGHDGHDPHFLTETTLTVFIGNLIPKKSLQSDSMCAGSGPKLQFLMRET